MILKKMLSLFCAVISLHVSVSAQQNFNYEISGKIPGADKILLAADPYASVILDSASNADGSFVFRGNAKSVSLGAIIVESKKILFTRYFKVFIEPGKTKVKPYPGMHRLEIRGSYNNDIMTAAEAPHKVFWDKVTVMYDTLNYASMQIQHFRKEEVVDKDSIAYYQAIQERIEKQSAPEVADRTEKLKAVFRKYPNSFFTAYVAINTAGMSEADLKSIYAGFDEKMKQTGIGKEWNDQLFGSNQLEDGSMAPDFAANDMNGKEVKLSNMRGKYILLDFWATWCGPCRKGNPHLIDLYNQYKNDGFEIIGISDDDNNVAGWKKAIKDDGIGIWLQVLRNRGKQNANGESMDIPGMYKVDSYPTKILIDKEGKIVHQFADDEELDAKLKEIFKKG